MYSTIHPTSIEGVELDIHEIDPDEATKFLSSNDNFYNRVKPILEQNVKIIENGVKRDFIFDLEPEPIISSAIYGFRKQQLGKKFKIDVECPNPACTFGKKEKKEPENSDDYRDTIILDESIIDRTSKDIIDNKMIIDFTKKFDEMGYETPHNFKVIMRGILGKDFKVLREISLLPEHQRRMKIFHHLLIGIIIERDETVVDEAENESPLHLEEKVKVGSATYKVRQPFQGEIKFAHGEAFTAMYQDMVGGPDINIKYGEKYKGRCPYGDCNSELVHANFKTRQLDIMSPLFFITK